MRAKVGETFQFRLTAQQKEWLEQIAAWNECTMAEAMREAIECLYQRELARKLSLERRPKL